jgi:hypothetical protein
LSRLPEHRPKLINVFDQESPPAFQQGHREKKVPPGTKARMYCGMKAAYHNFSRREAFHFPTQHLKVIRARRDAPRIPPSASTFHLSPTLSPPSKTSIPSPRWLTQCKNLFTENRKPSTENPSFPVPTLPAVLVVPPPSCYFSPNGIVPQHLGGSISCRNPVPSVTMPSWRRSTGP